VRIAFVIEEGCCLPSRLHSAGHHDNQIKELIYITSWVFVGSKEWDGFTVDGELTVTLSRASTSPFVQREKRYKGRRAKVTIHSLDEDQHSLGRIYYADH
jgi:hypothetical protein